MQTDETRLRRIALDILSRREHSRYELKQKLRKHCNDNSLLEQVITDAESNNYLSEERFVEAFITSKANRGYGPRWIQQALAAKQVNPELVANSLENFDWDEIAKQAYQKKYADTKPNDFAEKAKRQRYMYSRGF